MTLMLGSRTKEQRCQQKFSRLGRGVERTLALTF